MVYVLDSIKTTLPVVLFFSVAGMVTPAHDIKTEIRVEYRNIIELKTSLCRSAKKKKNWINIMCPWKKTHLDGDL